MWPEFHIAQWSPVRIQLTFFWHLLKNDYSVYYYAWCRRRWIGLKINTKLMIFMRLTCFDVFLNSPLGWRYIWQKQKLNCLLNRNRKNPITKKIIPFQFETLVHADILSEKFKMWQYLRWNKNFLWVRKKRNWSLLPHLSVFVQMRKMMNGSIRNNVKTKLYKGW